MRNERRRKGEEFVARVGPSRATAKQVSREAPACGQGELFLNQARLITSLPE
jgi:hypothetical protein